MDVRKLLVALGLCLAALVWTGAALADPSGERSFHGASVEPFYNAENAGQIGYLLTPGNPSMHANPAAWSPLYIVVYPTSASSVGTLNCMYTPTDNCPSHGGEVAGAAQQISNDPDLDALYPEFASVYAGGVLGHDHVGDFPGGGDFNIAWEPVLVLFTNSTAADNSHLVTDTQIADAVASHDAIEVPVPSLTFNCAVVPQRIWDLAG